jgi:hypothetical protein
MDLFHIDWKSIKKWKHLYVYGIHTKVMEYFADGFFITNSIMFTICKFDWQLYEEGFGVSWKYFRINNSKPTQSYNFFEYNKITSDFVIWIFAEEKVSTKVNADQVKLFKSLIFSYNINVHVAIFHLLLICMHGWEHSGFNMDLTH